jgi:rRNA maturation RNase YbeY
VSKIEIFYEDIPSLSLQKKIIKKLVKSLIINEKYELGEISFIFCSDNYLLEVNKQYLNHDYYTDIITFDYVENNIISGDLFISVDRVKENADIFKTEFKTELFRVIFHGVLHLTGYNDKTEDERKIMREKENYYLGEVDFREIEL